MVIFPVALLPPPALNLCLWREKEVS